MGNLNDLYIKSFVDEEIKRRPWKDASILDLGCGYAPYRDIYKGLFNKEIFADFEKKTNNIDVLCDAQAIPMKDGSFDVVLFTEVLEHTQEPELTLYEIARVLKPSGVLILTWPLHYQIHDIPCDYYRMTEYGLERIVRNTDLEIVRLFRRGDRFSVLCSVFIDPFIGFIAPGVGESLKRRIFRFCVLPFGFIGQLLINLLFRFQTGFFRYASYDNPEKLPRLKKFLTVWTLGYCAVLRKKA